MKELILQILRENTNDGLICPETNKAVISHEEALNIIADKIVIEFT